MDKTTTEKQSLISIRLPAPLKSRLLHLIADGKIKSIQAAAVEALEKFAASKEKGGK